MILKPKYNDEVFELNLDDPAVLEQATALIQKGMYFDKKAKAELEALREEKPGLEKYKTFVENYNNRVEAAKTDDNAFDSFKADLERALGRPLTKGEKLDAEEDFKDERDIELDNLKKEVQNLRRGFEDNQINILGRDIQNIHTDLGRKFSGEDGNPRYDSDAIQRYIDEKQLYSNDLKGLYESTYHSLNKDKIYENFKNKNFQYKRNDNIIQDGKQTNLNITNPIQTKGKSYNELKNDILARNREAGISFDESE